MTNERNESQPSSRIIWVLVLGILLLMVMAAVIWWPTGDNRLLKPTIPTATQVPRVYDGQFVPVSFPELQADPVAHRDRRIRVTGRFTRLSPPDCVSYRGPVLLWGLVADDLQMNARGLAPLLHLIPADTMMTVEGVWRRYLGPVGCGKEPEEEVVWFLVVERVVQPNPLPLSGDSPAANGTGNGVIPTRTATAVSGSSPTPSPTATADDLNVPAITLTPSATTANPGTTTTPATPPPSQAGTATPTLTPSPVSSSPAPTADGSGDVTATSPPTTTMTPTPDETPTPGPSPTSTQDNGPPPSAPTATPGEAET
ncbi:MAG: hypothetical protein ACE5EY_17825, partial [Anaerolineae bacterium]